MRVCTRSVFVCVFESFNCLFLSFRPVIPAVLINYTLTVSIINGLCVCMFVCLFKTIFVCFMYA